MSITKKPALKRMWSKSRDLQVVTPSPYEKNDASIKTFWKSYIADLELSYKDDKFWESNTKTVRGIVPPATFRKLAKIYNLPLQDEPYSPRSIGSSSLDPSSLFHKPRTKHLTPPGSAGSSSRSHSEVAPESGEDTTSDSATELGATATASGWSSSTTAPYAPISIKSSRLLPRRSTSRSLQRAASASSFSARQSDEPADSSDDLIVHCGDQRGTGSGGRRRRRTLNPHHELLCTDKSESDMITWASRYRSKTLEVSASDEFNRKAEITTKKIAKEFFDWYTAMGEVEFKSEIKRPEDIEQLFQVWFDEHASRGVVLEARVLPCVLQSVAASCGVPEASCQNALKRQVAYDIRAECTPKHTVAFGTSMPQRMKHIPPDNNTRALWRSVRIPQDLSTMACVWDDIKHLSSTKEFHSWLAKRPHLPMPTCLRALGQADGKKPLFVVPSDYVLRDSDTSVEEELALPVSQFNLELKAVLSQLMNQ